VSVLLGVDVGARRIGVAIGDERTGSVRPLATFARTTPTRDAARLATLAREHHAAELIVGLPLNSDGTEGSQAQDTRAWVDSVRGTLGLEVGWRDERYTSQDAEAQLGSLRRGRSGGPPSRDARWAYRSRVDRRAAALILQAELDARGASVA
jgi:putative Holliday junction resolvase